MTPDAAASGAAASRTAIEAHDAAVGERAAWRVGTARDALRAATTDIHERLHRLAPFLRIEDGTIGLDDYRTLLARLYGFHVALDAVFVRHADDLRTLGVDDDARAALLADDLVALGMTRPTIDDLPQAPLSSPPRSRAALLGVLYVREGSTLGGRVIARRLDPLFDAHPLPGELGRRFFVGDGRSVPRWRATIAALDCARSRRSRPSCDAGRPGRRRHGLLRRLRALG